MRDENGLISIHCESRIHLVYQLLFNWLSNFLLLYPFWFIFDDNLHFCLADYGTELNLKELSKKTWNTEFKVGGRAIVKRFREPSGTAMIYK